MNLEEINSVRNKIIRIADGNPASIKILSELYFIGLNDNINYIDTLVNLNVIGVNIWLMYKNDCQEKIENLKILINKKCSQ